MTRLFFLLAKRPVLDTWSDNLTGDTRTVKWKITKTIVPVPDLEYGWCDLMATAVHRLPSSSYYTVNRSDNSTSMLVSPPKSIDLTLQLKDKEASEWNNETTDDISYKWGVYPVKFSIAGHSCHYTATPIIIEHPNCDIELSGSLAYQFATWLQSGGTYKTASISCSPTGSYFNTAVIDIEDKSIISSASFNSGKFVFHIMKAGITKVTFLLTCIAIPPNDVFF